MQNIEITPNLRRILTNERKKFKKTGEALGKAIGKNRIFISQLETGKILSIDYDLLIKMFMAISNVSINDFQMYMDDIAKSLIKSITITAINNEIWLQLYDLETREHEINSDYINYITEKCKELGISYSELTKEINSNNEIIYDENMEPNRVNFVNSTRKRLVFSILFQLDENYIDDVVNGEIKTANYITLSGIIYRLLKFKNDNTSSSDRIIDEVLHNLGITRLTADMIEKTVDKINNIDIIELEEDFNIVYKELTDSIINSFDHIFRNNPDYTCRQLRSLSNNLKYDIGLAFAVFGFPFGMLRKLNKDGKRDFLNDLMKLTKEYIDKAELFTEESEG